jgi:hypothetical protein
LGDAASLGGTPEVTLFGQRQQKFKLVDQEKPPVTSRQQVARADAKGDGAKGLGDGPCDGISLRHFVFVSTDIKPLLIAFPYRRMKRLY